MKILTYLQDQPEVRGAVLTDTTGDVCEIHIGDVDDELVACMGFVVHQLRTAGEGLGLGTINTVTVRSAQRSTLAAAQPDRLLVATLDPSKPTTPLENAVHSHEWEVEEEQATQKRAIPTTDEETELTMDDLLCDDWAQTPSNLLPPEPGTQRRLPPPPPSRPGSFVANDGWSAPRQVAPANSARVRQRTDTQPWLEEEVGSSEIRKAVDDAFVRMTQDELT